MTTPESLLSLAIKVFNSTHNFREFLNAQLQFINAYKRADYLVQGEYHHLWSKWLKETNQ